MANTAKGRLYNGYVETHYYPFGLTMTGISSKAFNGVENKKKYNGIEFDNDLDLNEYDANLRNLDPQTGRWWQIDPKIDDMEAWSPYASNYDNPIKFSDPLGDEPDGDGILTRILKSVSKSVREVGILGLGAANAWGSDQVLGAGSKSASEAGFSGDDAAFYKAGETTGHAASILTGGLEFLAGGGTEIASLGTTSAISIPVALHGTSAIAMGFSKLFSSSENNSEKKFDGQNNTENNTSREAYRNAKDQNGIPRSQQPDKTIKPGTQAGNLAGLDKRNVRQDVFTNSKGQKVIIRKDKPVIYSDGGKQGNHYNAGQNPQKQKDLNQHHNY